MQPLPRYRVDKDVEQFWRQGASLGDAAACTKWHPVDNFLAKSTAFGAYTQKEQQAVQLVSDDIHGNVTKETEVISSNPLTLAIWFDGNDKAKNEIDREDLNSTPSIPFEGHEDEVDYSSDERSLIGAYHQKDHQVIQQVSDDVHGAIAVVVAAQQTLTSLKAMDAAC